MKNALRISALFACALGLPSCKTKDEAATVEKPVPVVHPDLLENQLTNAPTTFLNSAADSEIHWQNWSPEILDKATEANQMILAMVGSARYPGCFETLDVLENDPNLVRRINDNFVPVLADLDMSRETGLIAYSLSPDTGKPVGFPFLMILSPEGSPVTWQPLNYRDVKSITQFFDNSVEVISRLWEESPDYVSKDSAKKLEHRQERMPVPDSEITDLDERKQMYEKAIRRFVSSFDEDVSTIHGTGGLFPLGVLDTLTLAQFDPTLPANLRADVEKTLNGFLGPLLRSAMIDPLDGGIYPSRQGSSWDLPLPRRNCTTQARSIQSFAMIHQLTGSAKALEIALGAVQFAENRFLTPDGLFSLAAQSSATARKEQLWTVDQVSSVLSDQEFAVWKATSELNALGNLPSEADPQRHYFRLNSLSLRHSPQAVATSTGIAPAEVDALLESGRKKLLKAREQRSPTPRPDPTPSASSSFRMISAYAHLFTATRNPVWKEKAVALGNASRKAFCASRFINELPDGSPDSMSDGRAFCYAVAAQAGIDLGSITLDDQWYLWAQDLSTLLAEHFVTEEDRLVEVRSNAKVVDLDFEDRFMTFDVSTAGVVRLNLVRLAAIGFQSPPALVRWTKSLPPVEKAPILMTDSMKAMAFAWSHQRVDVGPGIDPDVRGAVESLPILLFDRRTSADAGNKVKVTGMDREPSEVSSVAEVEQLVTKP